MPTKTFTPLRAKRMRVTEVDNCGRVIPGPAGSNLVTEGFATVTLASETEDGAEILLPNASGALCVNEKDSPTFKYMTAEIQFCGVNPSLLAMVTNAEEYVDSAGNVIGFEVREGRIDKFFGLEFWTGLAGVACDASMEEVSGYMLLPYLVAGTIGEITMESENAVTFTMTGAVTRGGNAWGTGPYPVIQDTTGTPAKLPTALDPKTHFAMMMTGVAVPPSADDPKANPTA